MFSSCKSAFIWDFPAPKFMLVTSFLLMFAETLPVQFVSSSWSKHYLNSWFLEPLLDGEKWIAPLETFYSQIRYKTRRANKTRNINVISTIFTALIVIKYIYQMWLFAQIFYILNRGHVSSLGQHKADFVKQTLNKSVSQVCLMWGYIMKQRQYVCEKALWTHTLKNILVLCVLLNLLLSAN